MGTMEGKEGNRENSLQLQVRGGICGEGTAGRTCTGWWREQVWKNLSCEIKECEFEMC